MGPVLKPGSQIGQYNIERELGRGGMGAAPTVVLETTESIVGYAITPDGKRLLLELTKPGTRNLRALKNWTLPTTK